MFSSLSKIDNPLLRSVTAAGVSFSAVTMISAVVIGFTTPGDKSANRIGVYASLLGLVAGAGVGLVVKKDRSPSKTSSQSANKVKSSQSSEDGWKDWRNFEVVKKEPESTEITSFYLKPQDGGKLPDFKPGQFLTIKLDIPEQERPVIRTYSLSDYPESGDYYRLSIKRESSPKGLDVPPGVASTFMHDRITAGSVIPAKPPNGKFYIDVESSVPAVLISNGVGITPMLSMAKASSRHNSNRHIWFLHGARNGEYHACREEINAIAPTAPNLHIYYKYSRPRPEDEGKYHSQGYVDKQLLEESIIPEIRRIYGSAEAEYFLCGSPSFMDSIREGLDELGVPEDKVFYESFSSGKTKGKAETNGATQATPDSAEIVFARSQQTLTWTKDDGTILEFAEANQINPPFSCRQGICLTCMCAIQEGEVEYIEPPTNEPDEGSVLICISQPKTNKVVLDLQSPSW